MSDSSDQSAAFLYLWVFATVREGKVSEKQRVSKKSAATE